MLLLFASSRGIRVMAFTMLEVREQVVAMSPIHFDGNAITVERHEAGNYFYAYYNVYVEIVAIDFPLEHGMSRLPGRPWAR